MYSTITIYIFCNLKIFDNTPASKEGSLEAGDELVGVNKTAVKGKTKTDVARLIQSSKVILKFVVTY